jgi:hypothetical protein
MTAKCTPAVMTGTRRCCSVLPDRNGSDRNCDDEPRSTLDRAIGRRRSRYRAAQTIGFAVADDREDELEEGRMPLLDHLIQLRIRVMWSIGAIMVGFPICYQLKEQIYGFLVGRRRACARHKVE